MKITIDLPEEAAALLLKRVPERNRDIFISDAILTEFDREDEGIDEEALRDHCAFMASMKAQLDDPDALKNSISLEESNWRAEATLASLRVGRKP